MNVKRRVATLISQRRPPIVSRRYFVFRTFFRVCEFNNPPGMVVASCSGPDFLMLEATGCMPEATGCMPEATGCMPETTSCASVQHNDGGFPLVKPNYSARNLISPRSITLSLSLCAAANTCVSAWLARLSRRGILFFLFFRGVVPIRALLSRRGTASDLSGLPGSGLVFPLGPHKGPCREGGLLRCVPNMAAHFRLRGHFVTPWRLFTSRRGPAAA